MFIAFKTITSVLTPIQTSIVSSFDSSTDLWLTVVSDDSMRRQDFSVKTSDVSAFVLHFKTIDEDIHAIDSTTRRPNTWTTTRDESFG